MITAAHISNSMPRPDFRTRMEKANALNPDIIKVIHGNFPAGSSQAKLAAESFRGPDALSTASNIWNFLKKEIRYKADEQAHQQVRLPARFVADGTGDCKSYSLFAASVLSQLGMPVAFRYVSYSGSDIPTHVYVLTKDERGRDIIIDGVWMRFNEEKPYTNKKDYIMQVSTLSGIGAGGGLRKTAARLRGRRSAKKTTGSPLVKTSTVSQRRKKRPANEADYSIGLFKRNPAKKAAKQLKKTQKQAAKNQKKQVKAAKKQERKQNRQQKGGLLKRVGAGLKKVGAGAKTVALAPVRAAFLGLVALNVKGLATNLQKALAKSPQKVKEMWEKKGGNMSKLQSAITNGSKRKRIAAIGNTDYEIFNIPDGMGGIMGEDGAGEGSGFSLEKALAIAAPLINIVVNLLKSLGIKDKETEELVEEGEYAGEYDQEGYSTLPGIGPVIDTVRSFIQPPPSYGGDYGGGGGSYQPQPREEYPGADPGPGPDEEPSFFEKNKTMIMIGGAALGLLLLTKR